MLIFVEEADLPTWFGQPVRAGVFCVTKPNGSLRLIIDRRWRNAQELPLLEALFPFCSEVDVDEWYHMCRLAKLPHASMFAHLILAPSDDLDINADDLKDFYCLCRWPVPRLVENAVGPALTDEQRARLTEAGFDVSHLSRPVALLAAPAMGDQKAAELIQVLHQFRLEEGGNLRLDERMLYGKPEPRGRLWEGAYLDDKVLVGSVSRFRTRRLADEKLVSARLASADRTYVRDGLVKNVPKELRGLRERIVWGGELSSG